MTASDPATATPPLAPRAFEPLPLGQVKPAGWLRRQLAIQADGLHGHLDEFWRDVAESRWIGGDAEGWERGPYWLDGMVPLAFLLDDPRLIAKAERWVNEILARQHDDGWFGPLDMNIRDEYRHDPWPNFVILKALIQAHEATGDARIPPAIERFLRKLASVLETVPLRSWGRFRWADLVLSIQWLYDETGDDWLLDLARTVERQGFDWRGHVDRFPFPDKCLPIECDLSSHGPNNAMGIKAGAVRWRLSHDPADREAPAAMIAALDRFHGQAIGMFSNDEHLAGRSPVQGSELCAVVEYQFSLEVALAILGDPAFGDRLEALTFNALPATLTPDMWARQYDQQVNQVACQIVPREQKVYTSNGGDANIYGLEPHFGCCTPNHGQGWPKFVSHSWMRSDDGLAAVAWGPVTVATEVNGVPVRIETVTNYPFSETIALRVETDAPVSFSLDLRIPAWAEGATVEIDGESVPATAGTFHRVERTWEGVADLTLTLPMRPRVERRYQDSASVYLGPTLLSLPIDAAWTQIAGEQPHADWEVQPVSPWNYALDLASLDGATVAVDAALADVPFSPEGAPVRVTVRGRRLPGWGMERGAAAPPPASPVASAEPEEDLVLAPYGSTNIRIAEFPVLG